MNIRTSDQSVVLIGMPGAGKSTLGVVLAKLLAYEFIDTDILIQNRYEQTLQSQLDDVGADRLRRREAETLLALTCDKAVIATGGSAVYSEQAMLHLKQFACVVYLYASEDVLVERLGDWSQRGVAAESGQSFRDIYAERIPLYERFADIAIDTDTATNVDDVAKELVSRLTTLR